MSITQLKKDITFFIRDEFRHTQDFTDFDLNNENKLYQLIWQNSSKKGGLRLSYRGAQLLKLSNIECQEMKIDAVEFKAVTNREYINLTKNMTIPYYIGDNSIIMFNKKDAVKLALTGDFKKFIINLAKPKKILD